MPIETKTGDTEAEKRLIAAIIKSHNAISWYFAAGGAVSHDDVSGMFREVRKAIDSVADLVWEK